MPLRDDCAIYFVADDHGPCSGGSGGGLAAVVRSGVRETLRASARRDRTGRRGAGLALPEPIEGLLVRLTLPQQAWPSAHDGLPLALHALQIRTAARTALSRCDARKGSRATVRSGVPSS